MTTENKDTLSWCSERGKRKVKAALETARAWAELATCPRLHVGAVLMGPAFESISWGFNGASAGALDCDTIGCRLVDVGGRMSCQRAVHAEHNAILFARKAYPTRLPNGSIAVVTHHPCKTCLINLIQYNVEHVVYRETYDGTRMYDVDAVRAVFLADYLTIERVSF